MANYSENEVLAGIAPIVDHNREASPLEQEVVALFDQMRDRLLRYLLTFRLLVVQDCEEIVQEAFLALFRHLQQGRSRQNLQGWLFRVVHNLALKRIARGRKDSQALVGITNETADLAADPAPNPEDAFAEGQIWRRIVSVVDALPEHDRQCLALRTEGLRYREIAGVLNISLGSVAKSLERSLERIARVQKRSMDGAR